MVYSVLLCNALPNWIDRVPFYTIPLNVIRLQDLLRSRLHLFLGSLLARIEVLVCRSCNLDVESDEVVLPWNYHDRTMVTVYSTFHLLGSA